MRWTAFRSVEERVVGLALGLNLLGLAEARPRLGPAPRLVLGVGQGRAPDHALDRIPICRGAGSRAGARPEFARPRGSAPPPRPGAPPGSGRRPGSCA